MRKEDYVKCSFFKLFVSELGRTDMLFRVHKGFETKEALEELLISKGYDLDYVVVVKFLNMYYGVIFEDYDRSYVIGKLKTYYVNDKYVHIHCNTQSFKPRFYPKSLKQKVYTHMTLFNDLHCQDDDLDIILKDKSILKYDYAKTYAVLLALTFVDYYFSLEEVHILNTFYFSQDYSSQIKGSIVGINPFKGRVIFSNGDTRTHQFYEGNMYRHGYGYSYKHGYNHRYNLSAKSISIVFSEKVFYETIDEISPLAVTTPKKKVNDENDTNSNVISLDYFRRKKTW